MHIRKTICFNIKYFPPKDSRICHQAWLTTLTTFLSPSLIFYTFGGSSFLGMCWNFETQLLSGSLLFLPSLSLFHQIEWYTTILQFPTSTLTQNQSESCSEGKRCSNSELQRVAHIEGDGDGLPFLIEHSKQPKILNRLQNPSCQWLKNTVIGSLEHPHQLSRPQ